MRTPGSSPATMKSCAALMWTLIISLGLLSCSSQATPSTLSSEASATPEAATPTPEITPTAFPAATDTPVSIPPTPDATATAVAQAAETRTRYLLEIVFDFSRHTLGASQMITYTHRVDEPLSELVLVVNANLIPGVFALNRIALDGGQSVEEFSLEKSVLRLPLPEPLEPGEELVMSLEWDLSLPERSGELGYTDLQANLMDWYPFIPPYQAGRGWMVNEPWPFGEFLAYEASDFEVRIRPTGAVQPVIAAGAPARQEGEWTVYRLDGARSFAWSASPHYQVSTRQVGDVTVSAYTYAGHQAASEALLDTAAQALGLFSEIFSPYPYPAFTLVEASFPDGMEFDGLIFVSQGYIAEYDGTPQNFMTLLTVHETAHQWWFGLIGNDQANEPWLDEALATYSELIFYEKFHPLQVDWWWFFRVNYFNPQGPVDGSIYDFGRFQEYFTSVYHRGAQFHRDLRAAMGDEAYFGFLREYLARHTRGLVAATDFLALLNEQSAVDLEPLLAEYFSQPP